MTAHLFTPCLSLVTGSGQCQGSDGPDGFTGYFSTVRSRSDRTGCPAVLGEKSVFQGGGRCQPREVLLPVDVPLPQRQ
ncbi:MAG TPA: hypothetical protein DDZ08_08350, partial [Cobetia sp.]|nr:hypothetical protein [Cobetia sp.]